MNLLPLQNCRRLHSPADMSLLHQPEQERDRTYYPYKTATVPTIMSCTSLCTPLDWNVHRLYYPFKTPTVPTMPPRTSLCTILGKNITTFLLPLQNSQRTRSSYEA